LAAVSCILRSFFICECSNVTLVLDCTNYISRYFLETEFEVREKLQFKCDREQNTFQNLTLASIVNVLWCIDPLQRGDFVNNSRCYKPPAAYACAVMSHNNREGDAGDVFCRTARGYWLYRPYSVERVSAMQMRVHLRSVKQRAVEAE
jgi:hypothetical protein